jgi:WD40 repeat protein
MHREVKRVIGDDSNRLREYEKFPGRIYVLTFNHLGNLFAAGSSLDGAGEVRVYQADTGRRISAFDKVKTPIYGLAFSPDGKSAASAGFDGLVRLNDPMTGKLIKEFAPVPMK